MHILEKVDVCSKMVQIIKRNVSDCINPFSPSYSNIAKLFPVKKKKT